MSENEKTPEYPQQSGEYSILGPGVQKLGGVINHEGENYYTLAEARKLIAAETPLKLTDFKQGEYVEVLDMRSARWTPGYISSRDPISNHLHVETDRGPVTVASTQRIRRPESE
jgi:hypothetical protein